MPQHVDLDTPWGTLSLDWPTALPLPAVPLQNASLAGVTITADFARAVLAEVAASAPGN